MGSFALGLDHVGHALSTTAATELDAKDHGEEAASPWSAPFRLLDLPTELRLRVYEMVLAPTGVLHLHSTTTRRKAVSPSITTALLRTNHQIYHEASNILLDQNEVTLVVNAHDTCWPTISESRLSQATLERLQHFCVILDCTEYFNASYSDVDLDAFSALTDLKTLRISSIYRRNYPSQCLAPLHIPQLKEFNVVAQILERVPATTELLFGTDEQNSQKCEIVQDLIILRNAGDGGNVEEAPVADLQAAAEGVPGLVRGCKSEGRADVYAWSRAVIEGRGGLTGSTMGKGAFQV
ncbi:hypothetical protein LTR62_006455 [Meristemomyces frigidus]|uniref:F-box domain-containing protein n=1 Tax=Meristemomyces frigidus TaxID=1508187 RepID=A0AAN7TC87_9PEZI|nr:hypothetical protein LTR62_006455 [Meristemomyces frigidus]